MRTLLIKYNQIYLVIMLICAFLFFTVLDGKNQLLLALLKCTGKGYHFVAIHCIYMVPPEHFVNACAYI